jgi:hypothetical protein
MTLEELLNTSDPAGGYVWIVSLQSKFNELRDRLESRVGATFEESRERTYREKLWTWFFGDGFRDLWAVRVAQDKNTKEVYLNKAIPPLRIYNPATGDSIDVLPSNDEEKQILLSMLHEPFFRGAPRQQRKRSEQYDKIKQAVQELHLTADNSRTRGRVYIHLRKRVSLKTIGKYMGEIVGKLS